MVSCVGSEAWEPRPTDRREGKIEEVPPHESRAIEWLGSLRVLRWARVPLAKERSGFSDLIPALPISDTRGDAAVNGTRGQGAAEHAMISSAEARGVGQPTGSPSGTPVTTPVASQMLVALPTRSAIDDSRDSHSATLRRLSTTTGRFFLGQSEQSE